MPSVRPNTQQHPAKMLTLNCFLQTANSPGTNNDKTNPCAQCISKTKVSTCNSKKRDTMPMHCLSVLFIQALALQRCFCQSSATLCSSCITWSQDIRTALLCYSLLKVHDQAMLTRDGESLVLFSCLQLWDEMLGRNGLCINLGNIFG